MQIRGLVDDVVWEFDELNPEQHLTRCDVRVVHKINLQVQRVRTYMIGVVRLEHNFTSRLIHAFNPHEFVWVDSFLLIAGLVTDAVV